MSIRVTQLVRDASIGPWDGLPSSVSAQARKLVMYSLADRASDDGSFAWPSQETIARESELSVRQVRRVLRSLEADGFIVAHTAQATAGVMAHLRADRRPRCWWVQVDALAAADPRGRDYDPDPWADHPDLEAVDNPDPRADTDVRSSPRADTDVPPSAPRADTDVRSSAPRAEVSTPNGRTLMSGEPSLEPMNQRAGARAREAESVDNPAVLAPLRDDERLSRDQLDALIVSHVPWIAERRAAKARAALTEAEHRVGVHPYDPDTGHTDTDG